MKTRIALLGLLTLGVWAPTQAEPAVGVTPTLMARGTYPEFKLHADPQDTANFRAQAKEPLDIVVRVHDYAPGSSTGWHMHPGPVFITVVEGQLTFYERDDPTCKPKVLSKGEGYVDSGSGHIVRNESGAPAKDVSVIVAPVAKPFRSELAAPSPNCKF
jgi:quercetin dioxygenase-like cupin family protein